MTPHSMQTLCFDFCRLVSLSFSLFSWQLCESFPVPPNFFWKFHLSNVMMGQYIYYNVMDADCSFCRIYRGFWQYKLVNPSISLRARPFPARCVFIVGYRYSVTLVRPSISVAKNVSYFRREKFRARGSNFCNETYPK